MKEKTLSTIIKTMFLLSIVVLLAAGSTISHAADYEEAVSYWKMDGDVLDSKGANTGIVYGATVVSGKYGTALSFAGNTGYIDIPNSNLGETANGTISAWVNYSSGGALWGKSWTNATIGRWVNIYSSGAVALQFYDTGSGWQTVTSSNTIASGEWHQVTASWGTDGMKIYMDGVVSGTNAAYAGYGVTSSYSSAFANWKEQLSGPYGYGGAIDEAIIWDVALDDYDVNSIYMLGVENFETVRDALNTSLGMGFTAEEINQIARLYTDGKAGLEPEAVTIGGTGWYFYDDDLDGRSLGDAWSDGGYNYLYLGSGVTTDPVLGGATVPELPPFAAQGLIMAFGSISIWVKKRRIKVSENNALIL